MEHTQEKWEEEFEKTEFMKSMSEPSNLDVDYAWVEEIKSFIRSTRKEAFEEGVDAAVGRLEERLSENCEEFERSSMCGHFHGSDWVIRDAVEALRSLKRV